MGEGVGEGYQGPDCEWIIICSAWESLHLHVSCSMCVGAWMTATRPGGRVTLHGDSVYVVHYMPMHEGHFTTHPGYTANITNG
jgi:hypothetical protein